MRKSRTRSCSRPRISSSLLDHRGRQNVVRTSVTFLFLPHFDVICDLLTDAWQNGIYLLNRQHDTHHALYQLYPYPSVPVP